MLIMNNRTVVKEIRQPHVKVTLKINPYSHWWVGRIFLYFAYFFLIKDNDQTEKIDSNDVDIS